MDKQLQGLSRKLTRAPRLVAGCVAVVALAASLVACGSSSKSGSGTGGSSTSASSTSTAASAGTTGAKPAFGTAQQVQALMAQSYGQGVTLSQLPAIAQEAYKIYANPPTAGESTIVERCLHTTGACTINPGGTVNVAESEDANDPYYQMIRAMDLFMATRLPSVKTVTYTNSNFSLAQTLSNFRTHISQGANVIVGGFNFGNAMLPVIKQALAKNITVWAADTPIPGANFGESHLFGQLIADTCTFGTEAAKAALAVGKTVAIYTGPAGNSFAPQWQGCARKALAAGGASIVANGNTNWTPQGEQQAAAALAAKGLPSAILYDYDNTAFTKKFLSFGKMPQVMVGAPTMAGFAEWKAAAAAGHPYKLYSHAPEAMLGPVALYEAIKSRLGQSIPSKVTMPENVAPMQAWAPFYSATLPAGASFGSGLPTKVLQSAFSS